MPVIGLTGGLASGKSLITDYLKTKGIHVIDADQLARKVVQKGQACLEEIVQIFGQKILHQDGSLNRKMLGHLVFDSPEKRKRLEAIVHPRVYQAAWKEIHIIQEQNPDVLIIFSVPLLFETGHDKEVDKVIVVYADASTQLDRLQKRNGFTQAEARKRMSAQMSMEEKKKAADFLIDNTGDVQEAFKQVDKLLPKLRA
jgi:dephospho-CoA kinase